MEDRSNGVYVTHYDDYDFHKRTADSIQGLTDKRIDTIRIYSESSDKFEVNWKKITLNENAPVVTFIKDSINRIELIIK